MNYESVEAALRRLASNETIYQLSGALQFETTGTDAAESWHVSFGADGVTISAGRLGNPDATVVGEHDTVLRVLSKTEDPRRSIRDGRLSVHGDISLAHAVTQFLIPPADPSWAERQQEDFFIPRIEAAKKNPVDHVERVMGLTASDATDALQGGTPVIAEHALEAWEARNWTPKIIAEAFGEVTMVKDGQRCTMRDVIAAMERAEAEPGVAPPYVHGSRLASEMAAATEPPVLVTPAVAALLTSPSLWIGAKAGDRLSTALHRDRPHVYHATIFGRKRFTLFSPDQAPYLARGAPWDGLFFHGLNPEAPDLERFPEYRDAEPIHFELGPGDVLLIPSGWYHCVRTLSTCIAVARGLGVRGFGDAAKGG